MTETIVSTYGNRVRTITVPEHPTKVEEIYELLAECKDHMQVIDDTIDDDMFDTPHLVQYKNALMAFLRIMNE